MTYPAILFAPLLLLLPTAGVVESAPGDAAPTGTEAAREYAPKQFPSDSPFPESSTFQRVAEAFRAQAANQVRIEQQVTIRISPRPQPARPNMLMSLPNREIGSRMIERKMGKCLRASGIAGVQPDGGNRLLLFMRDQRIVSAELERACRSRDFYSGFYLSPNRDGQLCVDRDMLLSRSGANCKLSRIRQLVESED